MGSSDTLVSTVQRTHEELAHRLDELRGASGPPGTERNAGPHRGCPPVDEFVTAASRHVHAVTEVLLPPARRALPAGRQLAHDYLEAARLLEVVLAHVKAHEYGSIYEQRFSWSDVWTEVGQALDDYRAREEEVADGLTDLLDDEELTELAGRLEEVEPMEPSRPHPYLPHTGVLGTLTRRVVRGTDRAWDHAEGRPLPPPPRAPRKRPGLLGQYLLCDPRMEPAPEERETS